MRGVDVSSPGRATLDAPGPTLLRRPFTRNLEERAPLVSTSQERDDGERALTPSHERCLGRHDRHGRHFGVER